MIVFDFQIRNTS